MRTSFSITGKRAAGKEIKTKKGDVGISPSRGLNLCECRGISLGFTGSELVAEVLLIFLALSLLTEGMFVTDPLESIKFNVGNTAAGRAGWDSSASQSKAEQKNKPRYPV